MKSLFQLITLSVVGCAAFALPSESRAQLLITGNDEKVSFDENTGKTITHPAGKDTVSILDIADPAKPKIIVNLPLMNTITGPPVNLAITPDRHLALVANSLDWVKDGDDWKGIPDNKIYVIDLTASPPTQIGTVEAGKQASGMAINRAGTLALVANRAEDSVSVLAIDGKNVKPVGTVSVATQPTAAVTAPPPALPVAVAITPDGKRALVVKSGANRVGLLDIDGQKVSYAQVDGKNYDMATGLNPLNVQITPDGKLAIVNNIGGGQDGQVDTVGIIDLEASPPRVSDQVVVGDGPEGLGPGRYIQPKAARSFAIESKRRVGLVEMVVRADLDRAVAGIGDCHCHGRPAGVDLDLARGEELTGDHRKITLRRARPSSTCSMRASY